jgi:hypothetical protein
MRIERSPMRRRVRAQCVSEIRTKDNREKSHEDERKGSVCKWDKDQCE